MDKNIKLLQAAIKSNVSAAIEEDLKNIDKTSDILPTKTIGVAKIFVKQDAILCGSPWVNNCFLQIDKNIRIIWHFNEGSKIKNGDKKISEKNKKNLEVRHGRHGRHGNYFCRDKY